VIIETQKSLGGLGEQSVPQKNTSKGSGSEMADELAIWFMMTIR